SHPAHHLIRSDLRQSQREDAASVRRRKEAARAWNDRPPRDFEEWHYCPGGCQCFSARYYLFNRRESAAVEDRNLIRPAPALLRQTRSIFRVRGSNPSTDRPLPLPVY